METSVTVSHLPFSIFRRPRTNAARGISGKPVSEVPELHHAWKFDGSKTWGGSSDESHRASVYRSLVFTTDVLCACCSSGRVCSRCGSAEQLERGDSVEQRSLAGSTRWNPGTAHGGARPGDRPH